MTRAACPPQRIPAGRPARARAVARLRAPAVLAVAAACGLAAPAAPAAEPGPRLSAPSAIAVEASSGEVAYGRLPDQRRPIASATKLMTALIALERLQLSDEVPAARYRALPVESRINLRPGERLTVADLLRALLLASANDAAVTLAERVAGSRRAFVALMNRRARELGLRNTRFANPIGLDARGNHSTARDLATLTLRLRMIPFFRRTVDRPGAVLRSGARARAIPNRNRLVRRVDWIDGVKTGHTLGAGWVLVGSGARRGVSVVSVVLGAPSELARESDTLALLRHGFSRFRRVAAVRRGEVLERVPIRFRGGALLDLMAARTVRAVVPRGQRVRVRVRGVPDEVEGPIRRGQRLGSVHIERGATRVATVALVAASHVPEAGFGRRAQEFLTRPATLLLLAAVLTLAALLVLNRPRRASERRRHQEVRAA